MVAGGEGPLSVAEDPSARLTGQNLHVTDVTNASRTLLMNLETLKWDKEILGALDIPASMLPTIKSSSEVFAEAVGVLEGERGVGGR